jgi:hypothetical protein
MEEDGNIKGFIQIEQNFSPNFKLLGEISKPAGAIRSWRVVEASLWKEFLGCFVLKKLKKGIIMY